MMFFWNVFNPLLQSPVNTTTTGTGISAPQLSQSQLPGTLQQQSSLQQQLTGGFYGGGTFTTGHAVKCPISSKKEYIDIINNKHKNAEAALKHQEALLEETKKELEILNSIDDRTIEVINTILNSNFYDVESIKKIDDKLHKLYFKNKLKDILSDDS